MSFQGFLNKKRSQPEIHKAEEDQKLQLDFADAVIRARLKKGWSQSELAQQVGTRQANVSRIESGLANPTLRLVQKLAQALDIEVNFQARQQPAHLLLAQFIPPNQVKEIRLQK